LVIVDSQIQNFGGHKHQIW